MERRNFIQKSAVSLVGYKLIGTGNDSTHLFQSSIVSHWLHQLISATGPSKKTGFFLSGGFLKIVDGISKKFIGKDFKAHRSAFYFYGENERYCFFALEMRHASTGISEIFLPVLEKDHNGQWIHFTTLNGYELEAMANATEGLKDLSTAELQELLLPVHKVSTPSEIKSLITCKGKVHINTLTQGNKPVQTSISVLKGNEIVFKNMFHSDHCLTYSNAVA